jgi:hypothetical protein
MTPYEKQLKTLSQCLEGKKMTAINFTENEETMKNRIVDLTIYALGFVALIIVWLTA